MTIPELTFDGFGINGPDAYRSRLATFDREHWSWGTVQSYGQLFEASPDMLAALRRAEAQLAERYAVMQEAPTCAGTLSRADARLGDDLAAVRFAILKAGGAK